MSERNYSRNGGPRRRGSRFYREPSGSWYWGLGFVLSGGAIYHALTADPSGSQNATLYTLRFLCLGIGGLALSAAEFLPGDRTELVGRLRIAGYAFFWIFVALLLLSIVLDYVLSNP